jgi:hypothetical protein
VGRKQQIIRQIELAIIALVRVPPTIVEALGFLLAGAGFAESVAWFNSLLLCIALLAEGNEAEAALCFSKLYVEASAEGPVRRLVQDVISAIEGGSKMATCTPSHTTSTKVPGPGTCCAAFVAAGFTSANPPPIGTRVATVDSRQRCIVCEVKASKSVKNPGAPVIGRGKGGLLCPTSAHGCCTLGI